MSYPYYQQNNQGQGQGSRGSFNGQQSTPSQAPQMNYPPPSYPPPSGSYQQQQYNMPNPQTSVRHPPPNVGNYQQQYAGANNVYNANRQQQPQAQMEYSKYQFLPYGQPMPGQQPPHQQQQQYGYYGGQAQATPSAASVTAQSQQQYSYQSNQGPMGQQGGFSYPPPYGHPGQQQQIPSGQYYPPSYPPPSYPGSSQGQIVAPVPPPAPVPAPVPAPTQSVSSSNQKETSRSSKKTFDKVKKEELREEWDDKLDKRPKKKDGGGPVADAPEPKETKTKKSVPIMVGKRRGGRTLPVGVVKKQRAVSPEPNKRSDAWSQYMNEVKRYKDRSCEDERKNRPLVK